MRVPLPLLYLALAWGYIPGSTTVGSEARKLRVLTSFLPIYCFTVNVAGDSAEVDNLLPANVEPHEYQFSRKDLQKLGRADLIMINGLGLEHWLQKAVQNAFGGQSPAVVESSSGLGSRIIYSERGGVPNPHFWLDPSLARHAVTNIWQALQQADPVHATNYASNAARYLARLEKLDAALAHGLAPLAGAAIITSHDAFPYFARRYGLNIVGAIETIPDVEPSLKYLAALYRSSRAHQVQALFTEPPRPSRLACQMGDDLHLPLVLLDTLEAGPLNPRAYEEVMERNRLVLMNHLKPNAYRP